MTWRDAVSRSFRLQHGGTSTSPAVLAGAILGFALLGCTPAALALWWFARADLIVQSFESVPEWWYRQAVEWRYKGWFDRSTQTGGRAARWSRRFLPALIARDTARRVLDATDFTGRLTVRRPVGGGPWSPDWLTIPASALGAPPGTTGRVVIVPLGSNDTTVPRYARPRHAVVFPSATDGTTCITYLRVHTVGIGGAPLPPSARRDTAHGPCLYILRFGLPSRARSAWLEARDWAPATRYQADPAGSPAGSRARRTDPFSKPGGRAGWFASALAFTSDFDKARKRRLRRCLAGEDAACHEAVFGIPAGPRRHDFEDLRFHGASDGAFPPTWISPDSPEVSERADILRWQFGAERFAKWWVSDDTTAAGFEAAFGVPEAEWARRTLREEFALLPLPGFTAWEVLWAFVLVAGLVVAIRRLPAPTHGD